MNLTNIKNTLLLQGWKPFEKIWLLVSIIVITTLGVIWENNLLGFISAIAGILTVVMAAKGKIATFYFGILQASTYAYITFGYGLYGEAMLNAFFFLPAQFIGIYLWTKHRKNKTEAINAEDINAKRLNKKQWLILIPTIAITAGAYYLLLANLNATQPGIGSIAVILSVFAQILMTLRYVEQWLIWIAVNILTIALWFFTLVQEGGNDWAIFAMWIAFLVNSIYGYVNWRKISQPVSENTTIQAETFHK